MSLQKISRKLAKAGITNVVVSGVAIVADAAFEAHKELDDNPSVDNIYKALIAEGVHVSKLHKNKDHVLVVGHAIVAKVTIDPSGLPRTTVTTRGNKKIGSSVHRLYNFENLFDALDTGIAWLS